MATSGSKDFSLTRQNIIKRAFNIINVYEVGKAPTAVDDSFAADMLNSMVKQWQAEGIKLWNRREATIFTAYQDRDYSLGLTGDHATNSYVSTTLGAAEVLGQTVLTVTSSTGMTAADNIGIKLSDSTRQWTTIVSVDTATQVTVTDALTAAAASGATLVTYTNKINRPLELTRCSYLDLTSEQDIPIDLVRHEEYFNTPDKNANGQPTFAYYDKQLTLGVLYAWPRPNNVDLVLNVTYHDTLEDFDSNSDSPDFPQEWILALQWNLAALLAIPYGQVSKAQAVEMKGAQLKQKLEEFNNDDASLFISPTTRSRKFIGK